MRFIFELNPYISKVNVFSISPIFFFTSVNACLYYNRNIAFVYSFSVNLL